MDVAARTPTKPSCVTNPVHWLEDWQTLLPIIQQELQSEQLRLAAEQWIYQAGTAARDLFVVQSGYVNLLKTLPDGRQQLIRTVQAGDVFGFDGLVDRYYNHSAQAMTPSTVCRVAIQHLQALSQHYPQLERVIMVRCLRDLQHADERHFIQSD